MVVNVFGNIKLKKAKKTKLNFDNPFKLFKNLYFNYPSSFLLESLENTCGLARFSVLGFEPIAILRGHGNILNIEKDGDIQEFDIQNPFQEIKSLTQINFGESGFRGGLVGYVSYEALKHFENIDLKTGKFPDFEFGLFLDGIVFDRLKNRCEYVTLGENKIEEVKRLSKEEYEIDKLSFKLKGHYYPQEKFERMVMETKKRIKSGEIFQGVISNARKYKIKGDKLQFYRALREINPSPYMYHLKLKNREIIGSSPEMLVRIKGNDIETFPIAGTRKRGLNPVEDEKLKLELLNDKKELAEHLMLVDLARNDVGRVSEFRSVRIPEYMTIKKFSHVQHIVSKVTGTLRNDKTSVDAFASIFPAGTVSGAPKIRAIEIINQLEEYPRGPYGGALGYFSLNGDANFAITIRSLICEKNKAEIQAGAGIVHDSVPANEYVECENKAQALIKALDVSGESK
jgi:anthranilate synthase component I